jgi:polyisoprenoid-binding protein YceI
MKFRSVTRLVASLAAVSMSAASLAAPATYNIDPRHTYPSFEADHSGGMSVWRGKFNHSTGTVTLDTAAQTGTVNIEVDVASIDFGNDDLNKHARSPDIFDAEKYPTATYSGKLVNFRDGAPTEVDGTLQLHGVTKPLKLRINSFLCKQNQMSKKETCGADAIATFNRDEFGVDFGKKLGFKQEVTLRIQVEAIKAD